MLARNHYLSNWHREAKEINVTPILRDHLRHWIDVAVRSY